LCQPHRRRSLARPAVSATHRPQPKHPVSLRTRRNTPCTHCPALAHARAGASAAPVQQAAQRKPQAASACVLLLRARVCCSARAAESTARWSLATRPPSTAHASHSRRHTNLVRAHARTHTHTHARAQNTGGDQLRALTPASFSCRACTACGGFFSLMHSFSNSMSPVQRGSARVKLACHARPRHPCTRLPPDRAGLACRAICLRQGLTLLRPHSA
jgi:hypothetical protein